MNLTKQLASGARTAAAATSKERLRLWLRLLKVSRFVEGELRERLREEFDSTLPRFDVLAALYRAEDGLKMSELSGVLRVSNGNVTGIVERLVDEGLLLRIPVVGDRRATLVRLTQKGHERFAKMAGVHEAWVNDILAEISPDDARQIIELLTLLAAKANQERQA
ncbi:MAG: MarR family transcriptional regulator [Salaquimonas sp.]|jgi:DNA-binding MarR family transcriptional regulator|nr:MarR family transcriptional regulator [Salaquimonas sp.]